MKEKINLFFYLWNLLIRFVRLFFAFLNGGTDCIICGKTTYIYPICKNCIRNKYVIDENILKNRCKKCGKQLISTNELCSSCKRNPILKNTNYVLPLFSYRLWNKELLYLWKINNIRNLSILFSNFMDKALKLLGYKIIVPVPPRKGKIKKNGWDQIDELCKILANQYGYIELKLLKRDSTLEQKKLNRNERLKTIKSAYSKEDDKIIMKELKKVGGILPKSVCIIDDVSTTGSTIECCAEILKKIGVEEVNAFTLFVVD